MASKGTRMLMAGLAGLAAGVAIGILFAPDKGSKTRKKIKRGIREFSEADGKDLSEKLTSFASAFTSEDKDNEKESGK